MAFVNIVCAGGLARLEARTSILMLLTLFGFLIYSGPALE